MSSRRTGATVGNQRARAELGWKSEQRYEAAKALLLATRTRSTLGRGRGGSIRRKLEAASRSRRPEHRRGSHERPTPKKPVRAGEESRSDAVGCGRRAARQDGLRPVQARRPRADLPQVRLRHLHGAPRRAGPSGRRPELGLLHAQRGGEAGRSSRTATSTPPRASSGSPRATAGRTCARRPSRPTSAQRVDAAMEAIERENPTLKGVLPKNYTQRELSSETIGGLIDTFSRQDLAAEEFKDLDVLGRVYEYFLGQFASNEGKNGRRVLHAPLGRAAPRRDAPALPRPRLRPGVRLGRHVRPGRQVRRAPTAATATTSPSSARSPTRRRGGWRR